MRGARSCDRETRPAGVFFFFLFFSDEEIYTRAEPRAEVAARDRNEEISFHDIDPRGERSTLEGVAG